MCSKKIFKETDMDGYIVQEYIKTKKIQLYTINNKKIQTLDKIEIRTLLLKLKFLIELVNELQSFEAIKQSEVQYAFFNKFLNRKED